MKKKTTQFESITISGNDFSITQPEITEEGVKCILAMSKAAEENAKAIQAIAGLPNIAAFIRFGDTKNED